MKEINFVKNSKLANKIDLAKMKTKAEAGQYKSFGCFRRDITAFINNCRQMYLTEAIVGALDKLMEFVNDEIFSIMTCAQCYNNAFLHPQTSFVIPCDEPHLIIWAKPPGYNYWPAKVMNIDGQMVHVRFFGDHSVYNVLAENCFLYCSTNPDSPKKCLAEGYTKALNVS